MNYKITELNRLIDPVVGDILVGVDIDADGSGLPETRQLDLSTLAEFVYNQRASASIQSVKTDILTLDSTLDSTQTSLSELEQYTWSEIPVLSAYKLNSSVTASANIFYTLFGTVSSSGIPFLSSSGKVHDIFLPDTSINVNSVFGRTGVVVATAGDYSASAITLYPTLGASNNVYSYLVELSGSKLNSSGPATFNGGGLNVVGNFTASNIGSTVISASVYYGDGRYLTGIGANDAVIKNPGVSQTINGDINVNGTLSASIVHTTSGINFGGLIQTNAYLGDNGSGSVVNVFPKGNIGGWNKVYDSIIFSDGYNRVYSRGWGLAFNGSPNSADTYGFRNIQLPYGDTTGISKIFVCGKTSNIIVTRQGAYAFGSNTLGQTGTGTDISTLVTSPVSMSFRSGSNSAFVGGVNVVSASINNKYIELTYPPQNLAVLDSSNRIFISGKNHNGFFGNGYTKDSTYTSSMQISGSYKNFSIEVSPYSACTFVGVTTETTPKILSCGYNYYGQLGANLTKTETGSIQTVVGIPIVSGDIVKVDSMRSDYIGSTGFLALRYPTIGSGSLYGWGFNCNGILGTNKNTASILSVSSASVNMSDKIVDFFSLSSQDGTSLIIKTCYASIYQYFGIGVNANGQLGVGDTTNKTVFTEIRELNNVNVTKFVGLPAYTQANYPVSMYALDTSGVVWSTGYNQVGQLAVGGLTNASTFKKTRFNTVVNDIYTTTDGVFIYTADKQIYYAGYSAYMTYGVGHYLDQFTKILF